MGSLLSICRTDDLLKTLKAAYILSLKADSSKQKKNVKR